MRQPISRFLSASVAAFWLFGTPAGAFAERGDCGQPTSTGSTPNVSDALTVLRACVGQVTDCDARPCICDCNGDGRVTCADALCLLRRVVLPPPWIPPICPCPSLSLPCTSASLTTQLASDLDFGWTGTAHDSGLVTGAEITVRVARVCSATGTTGCEHDSDCPPGEYCVATCDCIDDTSCEITGPTHDRHCRNDLAPCVTNADCDPGIDCVPLFGPPLPLSAGGTPLCAVNVFDGPLTGTMDTATGQSSFSTNLRMRVFNGIAIDQPCPRCGDPALEPALGDAFTCEGGPHHGQSCVVEGLSAFGGTSTDCPPSLGSSISGSGLAIRLGEVTTGTATKTARLPCKYFGFTGNPAVPGSNPKCLDRRGSGDPVCSSNADCTRCTGDPTIACTANSDCTGNGACAEAPDQPITCGFWCGCGFCDGDASLPCFDDSECPDGQACEVGPGTGTQANSPQQRPNDCSSDQFICGQDEAERCATTMIGSCEFAPYRTCAEDADCAVFEAGSCRLAPRPCFESRITRTGSPSPHGAYCALEHKACSTNADCAGAGDSCIPDSFRPEAVALYCMPATSTAGRNAAFGITGPAALRLRTFAQVCRCGDSTIGCDEDCDDGNTVPADGCDELCQDE